MAVAIHVKRENEREFTVKLSEAGSETSHRVMLTPQDCTRLAGGAMADPEELVRRSFEFLLEREPKESILAKFDLTVIGRYFPEYEAEISRRMASASGE